MGLSSEVGPIRSGNSLQTALNGVDLGRQVNRKGGDGLIVGKAGEYSLGWGGHK